MRYEINLYKGLSRDDTRVTAIQTEMVSLALITYVIDRVMNEKLTFSIFFDDQCYFTLSEYWLERWLFDDTKTADRIEFIYNRVTGSTK